MVEPWKPISRSYIFHVLQEIFWWTSFSQMHFNIIFVYHSKESLTDLRRRLGVKLLLNVVNIEVNHCPCNIQHEKFTN